MSEIVNAEYKVVQERTLPVIASEILQIEKTVYTVAMDGAIQIGQKLQEAKEKVEHGQWENWCQGNLNYSKRKAERFMKIADEYGDENSIYSKTTMLSDLSISKALQLLAVPEAEVETFVEEHDIEVMTVKELEAEIKQLKEEKSDLKSALAEAGNVDLEELEELNVKLEKAESKAEEQAERVRKLQNQIEGDKKFRDKAIEEAVEAEREQLEREAMEAAKQELQSAQSEAESLREKAEQLERKLVNSGDENLLKFKIKADQLQEVVKECVDCIIAEGDSDKAGKMNDALKTVLSNCIESL